MSYFIKQKVNILWYTWSDYNSIAWLCSISSTKIVSNKATTAAAAHLHSNTALFRLWMNLHLNESSESMQLLIHKDSHFLSSNVHTIHPKCDISHFQYHLEQIE